MQLHQQGPHPVGIAALAPYMGDDHGLAVVIAFDL
jgi:hypothetical protein